MHTEIIPAINHESFADVSRAIERVRGLSRWIHLDVADGTFTPNVLWCSPEDLKTYRTHHSDLPLIEVHLMVRNPEAVIEDWIAAGANRIIVHVETITDFLVIKRACENSNASLMLSVAPPTPARAFDPYVEEGITCFQILAVPPGVPGQLFDERAYDKIRYIREKCPHCDIEVDGGVRGGIARKCREAGANLFAAASAIFGKKRPAEAVELLRRDIS